MLPVHGRQGGEARTKAGLGWTKLSCSPYASRARRGRQVAQPTPLCHCVTDGGGRFGLSETLKWGLPARRETRSGSSRYQSMAELTW